MSGIFMLPRMGKRRARTLAQASTRGIAAEWKSSGTQIERKSRALGIPPPRSVFHCRGGGLPRAFAPASTPADTRPAAT
jgi:hypothetical protein